MAGVAADMISFENISASYLGTCVLRDVSAHAKAGEFIALVGPNGSGKSTLLKAIAGLIKHGGKTSLPQASCARAKNISYLAQNSTAPNLRKVKDIIALGRSPFLGPFSKLSAEDSEAIGRAAELCETLDLFNREFGSLSGGEKMRVHLSRVLATAAPVLLADEPITALDPYYQISVMNVLRRSADEGKIIITALHDLDFAQRFADRIWVMQDGQLVKDESAETALSSDILKTVFRITADGQAIAE